MASSLYNLALDFSKELNYTKAIMARQGDKGITVTVKPFLNGLQMDTSGGTFTLKGTTPSNRYVDSVATSVTSEEVTFSLDGTFMSEAGYYKHCYVEYRKDDQILTTQDIIFFSLGVSDISQGQADEYVSQLEELIRKYNETFDAFLAEIKGRVDSLNKQITDLTGQAKTLQDKLDALKEEISKLGNLQVMYSNSIDFGDYDYSGNPNLLPNLKASDFNTPTGMTAEQVGSAIKFTFDGTPSLSASTVHITALAPNTYYALSADITILDSTGADTDQLRLYIRKETGASLINLVFPAGMKLNEKTKVQLTGNSSATTDPSKFVYMYMTLHTTTGEPFKGSVLVENIKLEKAISAESKATPYQPNLLDDPYWGGKTPLGENLVTNAQFPIKTSNNPISGFDILEELIIGETYTVSLKGTKPANKEFQLYYGDSGNFQATLHPVEGLADEWCATFKAKNTTGTSNLLRVALWQMPTTVTNGAVQIDWLKIEKGDTRTPNIEQYKYRGIGMRDSNNPKDYVWDLAPEYVEDNLATDVKISEITGKANNYTDGKVSQINSQLTASINEVDKKVTANTSKIATNTTNIKTISDAMPLYAIYSEGRDLTDSPDGTKIPIGALVATDFAHTASDLPYTISSDGITLTATRNCVLFFEGSVKLHGNNTFKFAYVKIRKNGSDTNFANVGSSANLNYMTSQAGQYVHTLVAGDKVEFTLGIDAAAKMFHLQLLSLKISEVKPV
ncbi:phage tail tape measure protein [Enterococcus faecium]|uniref:BppU family phage baseplate upper protein n=2 Tax=Bacteria TaxID=2 RepID=UPI0011594E0E|nr:BppU family phage baseplate upper protein [Enterococcus faecium]